MKKVLSVALASAMVLGMGANAFAISYSTKSNQEADWPDNFEFAGSLFVTNADGDLVEESTTGLNDSEAVDFEPGDTIWMPLYADDQVVYNNHYDHGTSSKEEVTSVQFSGNQYVTVTLDTQHYVALVNGQYINTQGNNEGLPQGTVLSGVKEGTHNVNGVDYDFYYPVTVTVNTPTSLAGTSYADRTIEKDSAKYYIGATRYANEDAFEAALAKQGSDANAYITVDVAEVEGTDDKAGKPTNSGTVVDHGHYTGNIDKNWSINLIEKSTGVSELIADARLYKATTTDVASYSRFNNNIIDIQPNAVYLQIELKDEWKTVDAETLTYYVYIADNDSGNQTNEVWVSGKYVNNNWEYVNFDWTNDASQAQLWKVRKGENGTAVFDFADKAFFTVKMYSGESMYLDLSTAYDKAVAGEMDAEADSFYKFDNENANFSRTGELIIVTDDSSLVPYEIDEDGNFVEVDAKYVEDYAIAHTNKKVDGFVFSTKTLGNYVLSTEELGQEEQPVDETPVVEEPTTETPADNTTSAKPNPETGAEDFVGLAVSLAVVSVAAAGALALKK